MEALDTLYNHRFFARRYKLSWRAPIVCDAIQAVLDPSCVVDVGCATGDLVAEWIRRNVPAMGIEGSKAAIPYLEVPEDRVFFVDLRTPVGGEMRFDLATCFEVMEHIEEEYAPMLVKNLTQLSKRLLISAAPPGQGGHHHVNCRFAEYWDEQFARWGFIQNDSIRDAVRAGMEKYRKKPGVLAIHQNLLYYEKG